MEHYRDGHVAEASDSAKAAGDCLEPLTPGLAAMASHEDVAHALPRRPGKPRNLLEQRVDTRIAGHHNGAACAFTAEIGFVQQGWREEQVRRPVDGDAEVFLGPRIAAIVTAKACFDMSDGTACHGRTKGASKRARRVTMDDNESCVVDCRSNPTGDLSDVGVRVRLAGAVELGNGKSGHTEGGQIEVRMLAGQNHPRDDPAGSERSCYW